MSDSSGNPYRSTLFGPRDTTSSWPYWVSGRAWSAREYSIAVGLVAMIWAAYWAVWQLKFVYFDDPGYVTDNLNVVRGLPLFTNFSEFKESVYWAFTAFEQSNWHPLTWLSHMLDVQLYGLNAGGHHVTNLLFHSANTLLLFGLFQRLTGKVWQSAAVAAMFAVHPMHVESVAWVAERKDVLSTFLGLLTMHVYINYSRKADRRGGSLVFFGALTGAVAILGLLWYRQCYACWLPVATTKDKFESLALAAAATLQTKMWCWEFGLAVAVAIGAGAVFIVKQRYNLAIYLGVFVLFILGLLAKPMLVTLPCLLLLMDFWPLGRVFQAVAPGEETPEDDEQGERVDTSERAKLLRRRARRDQRLSQSSAPLRTATATQRTSVDEIFIRLIYLVVEKLPLVALAAISSVITPIAQSHGGSMASTTELSIAFRLQNSMQSYISYIGRMFWPGKMMSLHLLVLEMDWRMVVFSIVMMVLLSALAVLAFFTGRRYATFGWFWYVGTLVPVIGFVQVGEQAMADRYTYIPYIGLFVVIVWGVADLWENLPSLRTGIIAVASCVLIFFLGLWTVWTNMQMWTWKDVPTHLEHALTVEPNNWNMLNNYGVWLWKESQKQDAQRIEYLASNESDSQAKAAECEANSLAFKQKAKKTWEHGIESRPTATDIHSNLGYAYSEKAEQESRLAQKAEAEKQPKLAEEHKQASDEALDQAENHLRNAVRLKPISARPHNNLGRVLLRRGKNADAIAEFKESVKMDPSLLEAHLNLAQVYRMPPEPRIDLAAEEYKTIISYYSGSVVDKETVGNFCQAFLGLADLAEKDGDHAKALEYLQTAVKIQPGNYIVRQTLAYLLVQQGQLHAAEPQLWVMLQLNPDRVGMAKGMAGALEQAHKTAEATFVFNFFAWAFATSPDPALRNPAEAVKMSQVLCGRTKGENPLVLDTAAASLAAVGRFSEAIQFAEGAINQANKLNMKPLSNAIAQRLARYKAQQPYQCTMDGSDRPY